MTAWQDGPFKAEIKSGDRKAICACGKTQNGPYCDGSHKGSGIAPTVLNFDEDKTVFFCGCGRSGNKPFCDGSHSKPE